MNIEIKELPLSQRTYFCMNCGSEFNSNKAHKDRTPKYCSLKCFGESKRLNKVCLYCGNIIQNKNNAAIHNRKYCSVECSSKSRVGSSLSEEHKLAISKSRLQSPKCKGDNLYNWKGGKSTENVRMKEHNKKRYYLVRGGGTLPVDYLKNLLLLQENKCFYCDTAFSDDNYPNIEHTVPIKGGGGNEWYNLLYSCRSCNSRKRIKSFTDFAIENSRIDWIDKADILQSVAYRITNNQRAYAEN